MVGDELMPEEIHDAIEDVIRQAQFEVFPEEYRALESKKPIPTKSLLIKLSPKLDGQGIIRLEGRLMFAKYLSYDVRYPILLPRGHHVTKLIVKHYHEISNHAAATNYVSNIPEILDHRGSGRDTQLGKGVQPVSKDVVGTR